MTETTTPATSADRRLLIIDDEPGLRLMVKAVMEDRGWTVFEAPDGETGLEEIPRVTPDVVLVDMRMPGMDGMEVLREISITHPALPVIMLTAFGSVGMAVEAMKRGAYDYLTKPTDNDELEAVLNKAWQYGMLLRENAALKQSVTLTGGPDLIGQTQSMLDVKDFIAQVGPSEATVLVQGESGTGKELVAELLHRASDRAKGPLIKVNCAALPGDLLESELFGYVKGAFTGAVKDKPGRFQLASGGTLFLDEIGEMPVALQAKLLRALQERTVEPLGGVRTIPVDVRIIAATNRDLVEEVQHGTFREDLYYRLNVLEIRIPPLRERPEDLPLLAAFLLRKLGEKNRKQVRDVTPAFLDALQIYPWPGNVRELENVLERALILARSDSIGPDLLPPQVLKAEHPGAGRPDNNVQPVTPDQPEAAAVSPALLEEAERMALIRALDAHNGHRQNTADALGISRRTLQYKLKKFGLTKR